MESTRRPPVTHEHRGDRQEQGGHACVEARGGPLEGRVLDVAVPGRDAVVDDHRQPGHPYAERERYRATDDGSTLRLHI